MVGQDSGKGGEDGGCWKKDERTKEVKMEAVDRQE